MDVKLLFIQPGRPMQHGFIERYNGTYLRDILDSYIFNNLDKVRELILKWMEEYNNKRPHDLLERLLLKEYVISRQSDQWRRHGGKIYLQALRKLILSILERFERKYLFLKVY